MTTQSTASGRVPTNARIVAMSAAHWDRVHAIYAAGIASGHATFAEEPPTWAEFDRGKLPVLRTVAIDEAGHVLGWAACSSTSSRLVYVGVVELSLYVDPAARGRGIGTLLMSHLVAASERAGFWTLQSAVFPENTASLALHQAHGFRTVGMRTRIGRMTHGPLAGHWRDTVLLERRSTVVG
ncbi:GCN5-related protein N-acetyltransferase [Beutenbergia cavernae DSM 12333]|uniref:GCN5-related protein N-acetyltransferase n=1 Tax=Beutenbergia cavernae (strain ATCC BAA-8 / DSM 12333 / CCUG 43141 / JCM 11478 / NBRC 16432 / NCIMB 13614 / HKI 0122) TaxID=471853 RepID=C5BYY2_BEUC1|nr:GNAT family N-acetyltransferase [Beutenbergia cavernae]ACQ81097.1 GCN5-related protein N-acetyltransferase [Beutenbergia cavernae DSM 12333]